MKYTNFGKYMRILRIQHQEKMKDVADILGVTISFLSAVETGKKNVPVRWADKIVDHYHLDDEEQKKLIESIEESHTECKIIVKDASQIKKKAAFLFARSFDELDDETALQIIEILASGSSQKKGSNL